MFGSVGILTGFTNASFAFRIWVGTAILTLHVGLVSLFAVDTDFSKIYGITVVGGLGMGCMFSSTIISLQAAVEPKDICKYNGVGKDG